MPVRDKNSFEKPDPVTDKRLKGNAFDAQAKKTLTRRQKVEKKSGRENEPWGDYAKPMSAHRKRAAKLRKGRYRHPKSKRWIPLITLQERKFLPARIGGLVPVSGGGG